MATITLYYTSVSSSGEVQTFYYELVNELMKAVAFKFHATESGFNCQLSLLVLSSTTLV